MKRLLLLAASFFLMMLAWLASGRQPDGRAPATNGVLPVGVYDSAILHTPDPFVILDHLKAYGLNATLIRLTTFADLGSSYPEMFPRHRQPWLDGRPGAPFDPRFWQRAVRFVRAANERGIQVVVVLFDPWMSKRAWHRSPWSGLTGNSHAPYTLDGGMVAIEEAYVEKAVEELGSLPNVIFEVHNESVDSGSGIAPTGEWTGHFVKLVKSLCGAPVAVNAGYTSYDHERGLNDIVTRHYDPVPSPSKPTIVTEDSLMGGVASYNYYYCLAREALRRNVGFISINWNHYRQREVTPPLNQLAAIRDAAIDLGVLKTGVGASRTAARAEGRIVFHSDRDGDFDIWSMRPDGGDARQLTRNTQPDFNPEYSPDGTRIVFFSQRDGGNDEVYVMDADGTRQRRLTDHPASDQNPTWSPDGNEILFDSNRTGHFELHVMQADGTGLRQITRGKGEDNMFADWSPDGKTIAHSANGLYRNWAWNVFLVEPAGGEPRQITPGSGSCRPAWSPDGRLIAHVSRHRENNHDIWLMDADGDDRHRLPVETPGRDYDPAWSPDGRHIVFASEPYNGKGSWDIYAFDMENIILQRLTDTEWDDAHPHWGVPAAAGGDSRSD